MVNEYEMPCDSKPTIYEQWSRVMCYCHSILPWNMSKQSVVNQYFNDQYTSLNESECA